MSQWEVVVFVAITLMLTTPTLCRRHSDLPQQMVKMQELILDTSKLIDNGISEGENDVANLQATVNNYYRHSEESIYFFHKAVDKVHDTKLRKLFEEIVKSAETVTYDVGKSANGNSATINAALRAAMNNYMVAFSLAKQLSERPELAQEQFVLAMNSVREAYDLGLFDCYSAFVQIKFRNKDNQKIQDEVKATLEKTLQLINLEKNKDRQISGELIVFTHYLSHLMDNIVINIERWAYLYRGKGRTAEVLIEAYVNLSQTVADYRKQSRSTKTTLELLVTLEMSLGKIADEIKKVADVEGADTDQERVILKDVLLDCLTVLSTLNTKHELLSGQL